MKKFLLPALAFALTSSLSALDVVERDGGFRFSLPYDFSATPNPRKRELPKTQFDTHFSATSQAVASPAAWREADMELAIETSLRLAANRFRFTVLEVEKEEVTSASGIPVIRYVASIEGEGDPLVGGMAFSTDEQVTVTYVFVPGKLGPNELMALLDHSIDTLRWVR